MGLEVCFHKIREEIENKKHELSNVSSHVAMPKRQFGNKVIYVKRYYASFLIHDRYIYMVSYVIEELH